MDYQLRDLLTKNHQRNTPGRHAVFGVLKNSRAITIAELRVKTQNELDTASLYRTLALFRDLDIIQDVVIGGQRKVELTDRFNPHHHHLACSSCGKTITLHDEQLEKYLANLAAKHNFIHQSHSFEVTGLCATCQEA